MSELNRIMLENAADILDDVEASSMMLFIDAIEDWDILGSIRQKKRLIVVTQRSEAEKNLEAYRNDIKAVLNLPQVRLTRLGQVKLSTIMGIAEGVIKGDDKVVCVTGLRIHKVFDTIMVLDLEKETEVFSTIDLSMDALKRVKPEVLETVLTIALGLSSEGREGKSIGTTFVIGDTDKVLELSRPLIMNPFKGYPEESRNILDVTVHETIKEFSLLDGAFIIREDGIVMSAGVHLDAALKNESLMPGLGCRHMAAAGITDVTDAVAITISGSTGIVRIFRKGKILMELEKPSWGAVV